MSFRFVHVIKLFIKWFKFYMCRYRRKSDLVEINYNLILIIYVLFKIKYSSSDINSIIFINIGHKL